MQEAINKIMHATPNVVKRWGEDMFCQTPLYISKQRHIPIYINSDLFKKLFNIKQDLSFQEMSVLLENAFSTTIELNAGTGEPIGTAWADYQADPLDLSLSGNLGSGRAYYIGKYFNIKGEKTPLAKSTMKKFSDGYLEMERSIWEAMIGNALQDSITTGLNTVLAIFDMQELCDVAWRDKPVKRGKIIRVDEAGELDRVTHYFYTKKPLQNKEMINCAKTYGVLEGDKFIERITHGNWSAGNISVKGHLIDFDTVGAVKGRGPCYSSTRWHHENRFGFEHMGQLKVLESLTKDKEINIDDVSFLDLSKELEQARKQQIAWRFLDLMGFDKTKELYEIYKIEIDELCELFIELAQKNYFSPNNAMTKNVKSLGLHLYDFSALFRVFPLLNKFDKKQALNILIGDGFEFKTKDEKLSKIAKEYLDKVYEVIDDCLVKNQMQLNMLNIAASSFITSYDNLFNKILTEQKQDINVVISKAYIINEDRLYLFPYFTASYDIAMAIEENNIQTTNEKITALIKANDRTIKNNKITDIYLYCNGYMYKLLNNKAQFRLCFSSFSNEEMEKLHSSDMKLIIDDKEYDAVIKDGILMSDYIDMSELLDGYSRENSLQSKRLMIYTHKEYIKMVDILTP